MDRSDGTHVAVGSALLGIGGVTLGIMIPLAAATKEHPWTTGWFLLPSAVAGSLGLVGLYTLIAVYTGWWLPSTATDRAAKLAADRGRQDRILVALRTEFIASHDGVSQGMLAGTEPLPAKWVVRRLEEMGETWRRSRYL